MSRKTYNQSLVLSSLPAEVTAWWATVERRCLGSRFISKDMLVSIPPFRSVDFQGWGVFLSNAPLSSWMLTACLTAAMLSFPTKLCWRFGNVAPATTAEAVTRVSLTMMASAAPRHEDPSCSGHTAEEVRWVRSFGRPAGQSGVGQTRRASSTPC